MGFRFRKSVSFGRLVRLNFSGSGVSLGLGPRGLNVNIGRKGVRQTVGIPGSGISYQTFSPWSGSQKGRSSNDEALPTNSSRAHLLAPEVKPRSGGVFLRLCFVVAIIGGLSLLLRPSTPTTASPPAVAAGQPLSSTLPSTVPNVLTDAAKPASAVDNTQPLTGDEVREVQAKLKAAGFDAGPVDGLPGPLTTTAIKRYQAARQRQETGVLDRQLLQQVRQEGQAPSVTIASAFEPKMTTRVDTPSTPVIYGSTNLPEGTKLIVTLSRPESKYLAQDDVTVRNGQFRTAGFSAKGANLNPGTYGIKVTTSLAELQTPAVREVIGSKGEKMTGPLVKRGNLGPTIEYSAAFSVAGVPSAQLDAKERQRADDDLNQWFVKSCNDNVDLINRMVRAGTVTGREIVGADREKRVAQCIKEVSR